ncbi:MAG: CbiX/SirB N-terminal domain-containing protein [Alphaproteobacteria bacterium]
MRLDEAGLIVVGHGSSRLEAGKTALFRHARAIAERGIFKRVESCFLKAAPRLIDALADLPAGPVFLVPFLMSEGLATRVVIPGLLGFEGAPGEIVYPQFAAANTKLFYCEPVGANAALAGVIRARAMACCAEQGLEPASTGVLLVAHGTEKDAASGLSARRHAARLSGAGEFARVSVAFLEEPPYLADVAAELGDRPTVVVGLFAEAGLHGERDVPRLLKTARSGLAPAIYTGPIGTDVAMVDLILDQVRRFGAAASVS